MSVSIQKTEYCEGCKFAEIEVYEEQLLVNGGAVEIISDVKCKHEPACSRMHDIMNLQRDYILDNGVKHMPIKSVSDVQTQLSKSLVEKSIREAFDPDVILRKQRVIHCKLDDILKEE